VRKFEGSKMMQPSLFDAAYEAAMATCTAEQALALIAKDSRVVQEVKDAIATHDANSKKPHWAGPSRTQAIRTALADALTKVS
jgi:hypothetical protein